MFIQLNSVAKNINNLGIMNKITKTLGKLSILLIVTGAIFAGISMLIIVYVNNKANMDYVLGWMAVLLILLSILMFIAFFMFFIFYRIKQNKGMVTILLYKLISIKQI
ncbi:hypothetical protein BH11BAC3_BH11BAC3_28660 [soil metagenome]